MKTPLPQTPDRPGRILVIGAAVLDRIFYVDHLPKPGETAIGDRMEVFPGGKGGNQALAARFMGAEVRFLSGVGQDKAAGLVLEPLEAAGIDTQSVFRIEDEPTAEAVITVDVHGENQITACPGAYHRFTPELLAERTDAFAWADWLLIQNELPRPTIDKAMEMAKEAGLKVIFNPAPFRAHQPPPPRGLEVVVANEVEAGGLLAVEDYFSITPRERSPYWRELGAENVIVTLGRNGGEWFDRAGKRRAFDAREVEVVDSVGAGDAFCGILAALLAEGLDMADAIRYAHLGASLSVTRRGAQSGLPSREELLAQAASEA